MAAGMLQGLFTPPVRQEDQDIERNLQALATMDPFQQARYATLASSRMAGQGLGQIAGAATGTDVRTPAQKNQQAIDAAKAQVSKLGLDLSDPKANDQFYVKVIQILQQQGLIAEAMQVKHEWTAEKLSNKNMDLKNRDLERKAAFDTGRLANASKRNDILAAKGVKDPETLQLLDMLDTLDPNDPADKPRYDAIMARVNALGASKNLKFQNLGDRVAIYDMTKNPPEEISSTDKGAAPLNDAAQQKLDQAKAGIQTKYDQTKLSLQQNYNSAKELYNMPGLRDAVGVVAGLISKGTINQQGSNWLDVVNRARLSKPAQSAVAKIAQVQGQTFIGALIDLKASSSTGASGLGSLTEVEGAKIQNAKAALDPQQPYESYRTNLLQYMHQLELSSQVIDAAAQRLDVTPKPLNTAGGGAQTAPAASQPATPAAIPSAAPVAPTTPGAVSPVEWELGPDNKPRRKGQ